MQGMFFSMLFGKDSNSINGDYHRMYSSASKGYYHGVDIVLAEVQGETGLIGASVNLFNHLNLPPRI